MRLVLRVARMAANHRDYGRRFARAVADLVHDGHFIAVIHGEGADVQPFTAAGTNAMALRHGVRRVRILPLSNVDCLSSFYFSSIEYGTEVTAAIPRI